MTKKKGIMLAAMTSVCLCLGFGDVAGCRNAYLITKVESVRYKDAEAEDLADIEANPDFDVENAERILAKYATVPATVLQAIGRKLAAKLTPDELVDELRCYASILEPCGYALIAALSTDDGFEALNLLCAANFAVSFISANMVTVLIKAGALGMAGEVQNRDAAIRELCTTLTNYPFFLACSKYIRRFIGCNSFSEF
jgi:hypothetical protein